MNNIRVRLSFFFGVIGCLSLLTLGVLPFATRADARIDPPTVLLACGPITVPGSYILGNNLSAASGDCVDISASDVTLNLNGFTIKCSDAETGGTGIKSVGAIESIEIENGGVTNCQTGIDLSSAKVIKIIEIRVHFNGKSMLVGPVCKVLDNVIESADFGTGLVVGSACLVKDNVLDAILGNGITTGTGCVVVNNTVQSTGDGIALGGTGNTVLGNTSNFNGTDGITSPSSGQTIKDNTTDGNTHLGINVPCPSNVSDNTSQGNGAGGASSMVGCTSTNNSGF